MKKERYHLLDLIRGATLVSMIAYHAVFDLVELYDFPVDWFWKTPGYVWQQSICWTFILLSGFCWSLGDRPFRRGLLVSAGGLIITVVTHAFVPSERILFGILTFTGTAVLAMIPLSRLFEKIPAWAGAAGSVCCFALTRDINYGYWGFEAARLGTVPEGWYAGTWTAFWGFPEPGFFSGDYFSFFPWFFLFACGYFLYRAVIRYDLVKKILSIRIDFLGWFGKYSLPIYMIHQPILMLLFECVF